MPDIIIPVPAGHVYTVGKNPVASPGHVIVTPGCGSIAVLSVGYGEDINYGLHDRGARVTDSFLSYDDRIDDTPADNTPWWANNGRVDGSFYDNNVAHVWSLLQGHKAIITLPSAQNIGKVVLWFWESGRTTDPSDTEAATNAYFASAFTVEAWNGSAWVLQVAVTGNTYLRAAVEFAPIVTTKIRITVTADQGEGQARLQEIEVIERGTTPTAVLTVTGLAPSVLRTAIAAGIARGESFASSGGFASGVGLAAGSSTATATGTAAAIGVGLAVGRSSAVAPGSYVTRHENFMRTRTDVYARRAHYALEYSGYPLQYGAAAPELIDGNYQGDGPPFVATGDEKIVIAFGGGFDGFAPMGYADYPIADTLVIHSSTHDNTFDTDFTAGVDHGLVGATPVADYVGEGSGDWLYVNVYSSGSQYTTISNNRKRTTTVVFPLGRVAYIEIKGMQAAIGDPGWVYRPLNAGTVIHEIELYQSHTTYELQLVDGAASTDVFLAKRIGVVVDSVSATATATTAVVNTSVSSAVATNVDASIGKHAMTLLSQAATTDLVKYGIKLTATSTADAVATSTDKRVLTLSSQANATAVTAAKIIHTVVDTVGSTSDSISGNVVTQNEVSIGDATATVIGIRKVIITEISSGDGTNANASFAKIQMSLQSAANAATTLVQRAKLHATEISMADARAFVRLPTGELPIFWSNTHTTAAATWDGLPFNSVIELGGVVYAADVNGIRKWSAQGNDLSDAIESEVSWDLSSFKSSKKKRLQSVYIDASAGGPFRFRVVCEQGGHDYQTHLASASVTTNHRAPLGRGFNSVYYRFGLLQDNYYSLSGILVEMGDTTRRI